MYIATTGSKNNKDVYIYQSFRKENGKSSSRIYKKLGKFNCWTANSGHHQQHFIVSQKLKTAAESRLKITLLSLLRHLIIIMSETDY